MRARFGDAVRILAVAAHVDLRGRLVELDFADLPFPVRRVFAVHGVPAGTERGGHRHRSCSQLLLCVSGRIDVELRKGSVRHELALRPEIGGLCIAAGVWARQRYITKESGLLVLADERYDPDGYDNSY